MLSQSYSALQQIQSQISTINTLQDLKSLLSPHKASISLRISSPTIWVLDWDVCGNSVSGTLELRLEPQFFVGKEAFLMRPTTLRLEHPGSTVLNRLETYLISLVKQFVESID